MELKICHLYPDVLNLYGDGGNIICMKRRLQWRGIDASVAKMPIGSAQSLAGFDLVFIGGGQDFEQQVLLEDLHRGRDKEIKAAIDDGVTFLTICGGYQMLGETLADPEGTESGTAQTVRGLGLLPMRAALSGAMPLRRQSRATSFSVSSPVSNRPCR